MAFPDTGTGTEPLVTGEQIAEITQDVWASFLALELVHVPGPAAPLDGQVVAGCVHVSGEWEGSIFVECTRTHADTAAAAMFQAAPGELSEDEVADALGELTNMVGGNVKGLLPAPSKLSIPSVALGDSCHVRVPGARLVEGVLLVGESGPVRITVWEV
jgi:chemotaxis protein CheX